MKLLRIVACLAALAFIGASCGDDDSDGSTDESTTVDEGSTSGTDQATTDAPSTSDDDGSAAGADCPSEPFAGEISSDGDEANAPFSLGGDEIVLTRAVALSPSQFTVYLSDSDLAGQIIGIDTIEAGADEVVITMQARNPDGDIELGVAYEEDFVIMDSGGGAAGSPDDPQGTVTFISVGDDQICFEVDFEDAGIGQVLRGTVTAEIV